MKTLQQQYQKNDLPDDDLTATEAAMLRTAMHKKMRAQLEATYHEKYAHQQVAEVPVFNLQKTLSIAAAFVLLFSAGWWAYDKAATPVAQQTASRYLTKGFDDIASASRRNVATHQDNEQARAQAAYKAKQFEQAATHYENIIRANIGTTNDYFELGLSLLFSANPDYTKVVTCFEQSQKMDTTGSLNDDRLWFTALAHVKLENWAAAKLNLTLLSNSKSSRRVAETAQLLNLVNGMSK
jgi:tetratricopeptide (TPR) repeat protein